MIELYSKAEIDKIKRACQIVSDVLKYIASMVKPGVVTYDLEMAAREKTKELGGIPAFLNYQPPFSKKRYPAALCVSINEEVVHGIPSKTKKIKDGDLVSLDFGAIYEGYAGDAALTIGVGELSEEKSKLIEATKKALYSAISECKPGKYLYDIAKSIETIAKESGFGVVCEYGGHGIGRNSHEEPFVANCTNVLVPKMNAQLKPGMVLAIEPMFTTGDGSVYKANDGWTIKTKAKYACHFEHTVAITEDGPTILTEW
ncbi:type I methionyl aminopeptidase [Hydrogenobaculum acidophilum]